MDDREFDALARRLATARSRRSVFRAVIGSGAALIAAKTGSALAAPAPKVNVCHWDEDTGTFDSITISRNGWTNGHAKNHRRDYLRGDCCVAGDCGTDDPCVTYSCDLGNCTEEPLSEVDCVASEWTEWSACSATCGTGIRSRTRSVVSEAACGGEICPPLFEDEVCTSQIDVDCVVSEWSEWSICSSECGRGTKSRTRIVTTEASCGGAVCGHLAEVEACASQMCHQCLGVTCPEHETCLDGECFAGGAHSSCAPEAHGIAANSGGVDVCACGSGSQAVCTTSGECPDGQVCILISAGGVDVGHCFMGCPFWNDPDPLD